MKKNFFNFELVSTILIIMLGFIFHFTFEWSNNNTIVGLFTPINESVWEHLKLLFFPSLITIITGHFYFKNDFNNYLCNKTWGLIISMFFLVIFFYTYSGILDRNIAFIDIGSFIMAVFIMEIYTYKRIINDKYCNNILAFTSLIIFLLLFIFFTFKPPKIGLFKDPVNGILEDN